MKILNAMTVEVASSESGCPREIIQRLISSHELFVLRDDHGHGVISRSCLPMLRELAEERRHAAPAGRGRVIA